MSAVNTSGFVAPGWEAVRAAFEQNLSSGEDVGAGATIYHRGQLVVDVTGGWFDEEHSRPYDADVLQLVFSTTKGITAIAVAICVQRGWLAYDQPVSRYWPEFAAQGKGDATVAQLLSHQCGLFSVEGPVTLEEALEFIGPDELCEVTPKNIRLRKKHLDHNDRKRAEK